MERFAAMSLFQPSNLRRAISESMDKTTKRMKYHLLGTMMGVPHTIMARNLGLLGFDFVFVDAQHAQGKTVTIVRVPNLHSELITHALDAGAAGIVFPHVDTAEQAEEAVKLVRYPCSGGHRSLAPATLIPGKTDMAPPGSSPEQVADNNIAVICQIESPLGLENAEAIARTPGVDSLMMGPGDFRLSIGLPSKPIGGRKTPISSKHLKNLCKCLGIVSSL
ncbi:uncharacterized protein N7487_010503 [Penicillium crustosum]|uniref:uncharacterized protein n=1 Tax=Penicillium crustosum TaxID=36656 RepID=UPI00238B3B85|nr:uncharacterized protein N7487_010503 [Penicillium crustosum]KAJ5396200.1 hypothetical protein N7487_010503 [Penicillium crustosum]